MGRRPEFIDPKFVAQGESREGEAAGLYDFLEGRSYC